MRILGAKLIWRAGERECSVRKFWRGPAPEAQRATLPPARGLFVIGTARGGTTILQNALNHSPDIFMLSEPNLHTETNASGFAQRYNEMHRSWSNQETKSTFCPPVLAQDGPWEEHLGQLATHHKWVGAKIVVDRRHDTDWGQRLFAFQCERFFTSRYIFTLRPPLAFLNSNTAFQNLFSKAGPPEVLLSIYAGIIVLYVRMLRVLPHVRLVFHDQINQATFDSLGDWLGVSLEGTASYYETTRIAHHEQPALTDAETARLEQLTVVYEDLQRIASLQNPQHQIEQNDNHLLDSHFTLLGSVDKRARQLSIL